MRATDASTQRDTNADYRYFYLKTDVTQIKKIMLLYIIPLFGFTINDFLFYGFSSTLIILIAARVCLVIILVLEVVLLGKTKTYQDYDRVVLLATSILIIGGGFINITRPQNYIMHAVMAIVAVFVLFLMIQTKFRHQCFLASFTIVGEIGIIILSADMSQSMILYTLIFSMVTAFILAAYSAWQIHIYRRRTFEEYIKRKELQEQLKNNADNLARLVDLRTKELVDTQARLLKSERLATIGELAGMVGHDLRNPLAGIKNAAYFLRKKNLSVLDESGQVMLATIDRSVNHADKIIGDLLEYSRDIKLQYSEQNSKSLLNTVLSSLSIPQQIQVLDHTEPSPVVMVDGDKLERVFTNLITNAFEAMADGGTLEITSRQKGANVEFVFSDTGVGIPQEVISRLFAPLVTTKAQGMGFGLAICKRFVEAHGGEISVDSVQNKGTTFTVTVPIKPVSKSDSNDDKT